MVSFYPFAFVFSEIGSRVMSRMYGTVQGIDLVPARLGGLGPHDVWPSHLPSLFALEFSHTLKSSVIVSLNKDEFHEESV